MAGTACRSRERVGRLITLRFVVGLLDFVIGERTKSRRARTNIYFFSLLTRVKNFSRGTARTFQNVVFYYYSTRENICFRILMCDIVCAIVLNGCTFGNGRQSGANFVVGRFFAETHNINFLGAWICRHRTPLDVDVNLIISNVLHIIYWFVRVFFFFFW